MKESFEKNIVLGKQLSALTKHRKQNIKDYYADCFLLLK